MRIKFGVFLKSSDGANLVPSGMLEPDLSSSKLIAFRVPELDGHGVRFRHTTYFAFLEKVKVTAPKNPGGSVQRVGAREVLRCAKHVEPA